MLTSNFQHLTGYDQLSPGNNQQLVQHGCYLFVHVRVVCVSVCVCVCVCVGGMCVWREQSASRAAVAVQKTCIWLATVIVWQVLVNHSCHMGLKNVSRDHDYNWSVYWLWLLSTFWLSLWCHTMPLTKCFLSVCDTVWDTMGCPALILPFHANSGEAKLKKTNVSGWLNPSARPSFCPRNCRRLKELASGSKFCPTSSENTKSRDFVL